MVALWTPIRFATKVTSTDMMVLAHNVSAAKNYPVIPVLSGIVSIYVVTFILDVSLPPTYAMGKFYIFPSFLLFFIRSSRVIFLSSAMGLGFLAAGYIASRHNIYQPTQEFLTNRLFGAIVICFGGWLAARYRRSAIERERSETALREAHRIARLGHFEFVLADGQMVFCSAQCLEIIGLYSSEGISLSDFVNRIVHPDDRQHVMRRTRIGLGRRGQYEVEFRVIRTDGIICDVISYGELGRVGPNLLPGITGTLFDVSEWRSADRARRDSEARMRSILEAVPDALVIISTEGLIQTFSASAEVLFGYQADEIVGKSIAMLLASPCRTEQQRFLKQYVETGENRESLVRRWLNAERKDGTTFPIELTVAGIRIDRQTMLTIFIRDLTMSRRMEEELRQLQKVEAIGHLAGGIAHDFNNLLTVIMGNLEILEARLRQRPLQALVRTTRDTAELGARLSDRLLTFGRRQPLAAKRIDLSQLIDDLESLLGHSLGENIQLESYIAPDLPPVFVDPAQFQVAMFNLALNAKDAMPAGGRLSITATNVFMDEDNDLPFEPPTGNFVLVEMADTGAGIPDHIRQHVLEPFFTTKAAGAGTGLGLPIVYNFITQSDGYLHIDSEPGRGTSVFLFLPTIPGGEVDALTLERSGCPGDAVP